MHANSDRYNLVPTECTPEITLRVFRGMHTVAVLVQLSRPSPDRFYDLESDESAIFESPFHFHSPVPKRNVLIKDPRKSNRGLGIIPPNEVPAKDLQVELEQEDRGPGRRVRRVWRSVRE